MIDIKKIEEELAAELVEVWGEDDARKAGIIFTFNWKEWAELNGYTIQNRTDDGDTFILAENGAGKWAEVHIYNNVPDGNRGRALIQWSDDCDGEREIQDSDSNAAHSMDQYLSQ